MEYEQALIIGKRRREDAVLALSVYVKEKATEVCAVKPSKNFGLDARGWTPVGEQNLKEICIRSGSCKDGEVYLLIVDEDGMTKACTQKTYPLSIALQMAFAIPLPVYTGRGATLIDQIQNEVMRKI